MVKSVSSVRVLLPASVTTDAEKVTVWKAMEAAHKAHIAGSLDASSSPSIFGKKISGFPGDFPLVKIPLHQRELENNGLIYDVNNPEDAEKLKAMTLAAVDVHNAIKAVREEMASAKDIVPYQDPDAQKARERAEKRRANEQERYEAPVEEQAVAPGPKEALPSKFLAALIDREEDRIAIVAALASHTFKLAQNNQNTYVFDGTAPGAESEESPTDDAAGSSLKPVESKTDVKVSSAPASMTVSSTGFTINTKDGDVRTRFLMVRDELVSVLRKTGLLDEDLKPTLTGRVAMYLVSTTIPHSTRLCCRNCPFHRAS